jgi:hypothetical protein
VSAVSTGEATLEVRGPLLPFSDTGHKLLVHRVPSSRNALPSEPAQRISEEHRGGIPNVYRPRTAPSTYACAGPAGAIRNQSVGSSCWHRHHAGYSGPICCAKCLINALTGEVESPPKSDVQLPDYTSEWSLPYALGREDRPWNPARLRGLSQS